MGTFDQEKKPEVTPAWLRQIVSAFEAVEGLRPEPPWLQGDFPTWVNNVGRELTKSLLSTATLRVGRVWEPGEVGALVGHQLAYWHFITEWLAGLEKSAARKTPEQAKADDALWEHLKRAYGEGFEERIAEFWRSLLEDGAPAFMHAVSMALTIASEQAYDPMKRFFAAFSKAVGRKPVRGNGIGRATTLLYLVMLTGWGQVEKLGSIPALHEFLRKNIFLSPQMVGDPKRLEKICQRVGLSYREIAERKARASNPDMSA
jgi:hypothetical protein